MLRTNKFSSKYTNQRKKKQILPLAREYKTYYNHLVRTEFSRYYQTGQIPPKFLSRSKISRLSERYKQVCGVQVVGALNSWFSNTQRNIRRILERSSLTDKEKLICHTINKFRLWYQPDIHIRREPVPKEYIRLVRRIFKHAKGKMPRMRNICMVLDKKVAVLEKSSVKEFDYWIKLSTLNSGKPIRIPIKSYDYFNKRKGKIKPIIQIIVKPRSNSIVYGLIKTIEPINRGLVPGKEMGIDIGAINLINTSTGNQYGRSLFKLLKKYDAYIQNLISGRQKDGMPVKKGSCPKLDALYQRVRYLVKNEIGRSINNLIEKERSFTIHMERIKYLVKDLKKDKRLSRTLRRLLINSGISQIPKWLLEKSEEFNFKIKEGNSSYTSQECHKCHYLDKKNRKYQSKFECLNCGNKCNADYNASRVILSRRSVRGISPYMKPNIVKGILRKHYADLISSRHQAVYSSAVLI